MKDVAWMISCIVVGGIIGAVISGTRAKTVDMIKLEPNPDRFVAPPFSIGDVTVYEFRNSQGGTCVLAIPHSNGSASPTIWCMRQLPDLDYEALPRSQ